MSINGGALTYAMCNRDHYAFAFVAAAIMAATLVSLKMISTGNTLAAAGRAVPAYFFFGDTRTMSRRLGAGGGGAGGADAFTTMSGAAPDDVDYIHIHEDFVDRAAAAASETIETVFDQFVVPAVYRYGAI
jgi:hypothetical protein